MLRTALPRRLSSVRTSSAHWTRRAPALLLGAVAVLASGCDSKPELGRAWGMVTFDGAPVESGTIELTPIDGTGGPSTGAAIEAGHYEVPDHHGVRVGGTYRVAITAMKQTGQTTRNLMDPIGPPLPVIGNYIPPQYNTQSKLTISVPEDETSGKFDFPLEQSGAIRSQE